MLQFHAVPVAARGFIKPADQQARRRALSIEEPSGALQELQWMEHRECAMDRGGVIVACCWCLSESEQVDYLVSQGRNGRVCARGNHATGYNYV